VLRCGYEDSLFKEMTLKQMLTLCPPMGRMCADAGQETESVRPT